MDLPATRRAADPAATAVGNLVLVLVLVTGEEGAGLTPTETPIPDGDRLNETVRLSRLVRR